MRWWLEERVPSRLREVAAATGGEGEGAAAPPCRLELVTGWGKHRGPRQRGDVRARVEQVLDELGVPTLPTANPGAHACLSSTIPLAPQISPEVVASVTAMRDELGEA